MIFCIYNEHESQKKSIAKAMLFFSVKFRVKCTYGA